MFVTRFFTDDAKNGFGGHRERRGVRVPTTGFRARQKPRARFPLSALSPGFSSNSACHTNSETTIPGPVDLNHSAALDDRLKRCTVSASQQQTTRTFRAEAMYRLRGPSSDPRRGWWKWGGGGSKIRLRPVQWRSAGDTRRVRIKRTVVGERRRDKSVLGRVKHVRTITTCHRAGSVRRVVRRLISPAFLYRGRDVVRTTAIRLRYC